MVQGIFSSGFGLFDDDDDGGGGGGGGVDDDDDVVSRIRMSVLVAVLVGSSPGSPAFMHAVQTHRGTACEGVTLFWASGLEDLELRFVP